MGKIKRKSRKQKGGRQSVKKRKPRKQAGKKRKPRKQTGGRFAWIHDFWDKRTGKKRKSRKQTGGRYKPGNFDFIKANDFRFN